jgi:AbrB family looped-hinge helix DNA binding protein
MTTKLSSKGQIVLPAEIRAQDRLASGEEFTVERVESGAYLLTRVQKPGTDGFVDWLTSCPETDWFVPIESESTDTL